MRAVAPKRTGLARAARRQAPYALASISAGIAFGAALTFALTASEGRGAIGVLPANARTRATTIRHRAAATYRISPAHTANLTYVLDRTDVKPHDSLANRYAGRNVSDFPGDLSSAVVGLSHEWRPAGERLVAVTRTRGYALLAHGTPSNLGNATVERAPRATNRTASFGASEAVRYFLTPTTFVKASVEAARRLPTPSELFGDGILVIAPPRTERKPERRRPVRPHLRRRPPCAGRSERLLDECARPHLTLSRRRRPVRVHQSRRIARPWRGPRSQGRPVALVLGVRECDLPRRARRAPDHPRRDSAAPSLRSPAATHAVAVRHGDGGRPRGRSVRRARLFHEASSTAPYFYASELSRRHERRIPRALTHTIGVEQQWLDRGLTASIEVGNVTNVRLLNRFNFPRPGRQLRAKIRYTWIGR